MENMKIAILPNLYLKENGTFDKDKAFELSGKIAGVCYDKEGFEHLLKEDIENTKKRINNTLNNATYAYNECKKLSDNDSNYKNFCEELVTQHEIYLECLNKPNDKNCSKFVKNYKIQNKNTEEIFA